MKMRAVVKDKAGPGFSWQEVERPRAGSHRVIVQVKAVGICGSDIPIFDGIRPVPPNLIPGHEFAGVITEVGHNVREWQVGDRVAVSLVKGCRRCHYCRIGEESLCEELTEIGIHINGAYAEYVSVPVSCLHRLPEGMSFEEGAAVDPIASAYRGVRKAAIRPEDVVAIFGPGPIGLYALQTTLAHGPRLTIMVGRSKERLEVARLLGADHTISSKEEDPAQAIARYTEGQMADVVIEATGNPHVLQKVVESAGKGARVILIGIFHEMTGFEPSQIVRKELNVQGSFCYNWDDFAASLRLLARGRVTTRHVITHILPLTKIDEALNLIKARQAIKVILKP